MTERTLDERPDQSWSWAGSSNAKSTSPRTSLAAQLTHLGAILVPLLLGALIGALLGAAIGALTVPAPAAIVRLAVAPDPAFPGRDSATGDEDRFVQASALVLSGDDMASALKQRLALDEVPTISATQVGTTDVVEVRVTARSSSQATAAAAALVEGYKQQRSQLLAGRVDSEIAVVDQQLRAAAEAQPAVRSDVERDRLTGVRNQLQLLRDADNGQVTVVAQPRAVERSYWSSAWRTGVGGLVLGALAGLLVMLLRRRPRLPAATAADS